MDYTEVEVGRREEGVGMLPLPESGGCGLESRSVVLSQRVDASMVDLAVYLGSRWERIALYTD